MLNQSSSSAFCAAVRVRLADGGEFLIWAAGRERPDEGLVELFSVAHEGMTYAGAVANGDKAAPIIVDEQGEARGRCALTLFENERYFWRWRGGDGNKPGSSLTDAAGKAEWSAYQEHDCWRGQFRVMNYLGFAWIEVAGVKIRFEVQTRKLDYETEYHRMVEAIAEECQQLLLEWDSPVSMHIAADPDRSSETLLERFLFLRHVLAPDRIDFFLELVRRRPHTLLVKERTWEPAACAGYVAVAADPAAHDTRVLVPYRPGKWLGWWAMIKKRELVHRDTLAARLRTKPGRHEALYYYLLELEDPVAFEALPVARPPVIAGAPSPCSWGDLHERSKLSAEGGSASGGNVES